MSSFKGLFPTLPGISCDYFAEEAEKSDQFFLSHCHSGPLIVQCFIADHMVGLDTLSRLLNRRNSVRVNHRLYCSMTSKAFVLRKFPFLKERIIKDLFPHERSAINVYDRSSESFYELSVTAIPSHHCPGSLMFLLEAKGKRVLYTGDFRFEDNNVYKGFRSLHDATSGSPLALDELYLDTTFCHPGYKTFPSREESIEEIWKLVNGWIRKMGFTATQYGSERILREIFERSGCHWRIHVSQRKFQDYLCSDELGDCTTTDPSAGEWIHACSWQDEEVIKASRVKPSALYFRNTEGDEESMSFVKQTRKQTFRVCYSSHSSMDELLEFVQYFRPKKIIPCVVPPGMTRSQVNGMLETKEGAPFAYNEIKRKRRSSELYLSSSSSEGESSAEVLSKRKLFRRCKNPHSKSEDTTLSHAALEPPPSKRRASLPYNFKIPAITITPSSPCMDPNHPNYPEFYEGKFYVESMKNYSSSASQSVEDENNEGDIEEVVDLDSTPELDVIFQNASTGTERENCINFAKSKRRKKQGGE
ncbi:Uncharacterized protein FKW44_016000 [Caligus rogercresseyi]|uniref:Protein artemis n=1 Tax=Caligus rogercresseyi TaxID=217165 RepID=A0A7T8H1S6_CALRO|nr:Uncharacterized protein FKW44_016000 [Caligus rogercresseyi]